ncbi:hypothetical protein GWK47_053842 [Chionoecetes opilio]|uniref:Uncharacterized protein n=1 Tax=Chionoecetes opilio TaxID=41210 RepID=A0A8J4Y0N3_CHIOP|nr:hypothetical protein GWK47_053842 [Chionoecetes opilio]
MILAPLGRTSSLQPSSPSKTSPRRKPHGFCPFEVIFGRVALFPLTAKIPAYGTDPAAAPMGAYLSALRDGLQAAQRVCSVHPTSKPSRHRTLFIPGMRILVTTPPTCALQASPEMDGPFHSCPIPNAYQGCLPQRWGPHSSWCGCKPYTEPPDPTASCSSTSPLPGVPRPHVIHSPQPL